MELLENILSQGMVQRLGWMLVHFVWQASMVALLLAILLKLLRRSSANLRYIVACLALVAAVLLPVITMNLIPVAESYSEAEAAPAPAPEPVAIISIQAEIELPANIETPAIETELPVQDIAPTPVIPLRQRTTEALEPTLPYVVMAWLVGVFGLSLWYLGGWTQLQRLKQRMVKPVDESLRGKLKELAGILGINRAVQLMESALVQTPTVVGWLKPVILLPASVLTGFSADQLEAILAHELAHIKRYDYLVNMLQTVVEILGFYHPAVWWISKKIRVERENCCDDIAVRISGDSIGYAKTLALFDGIRAGRSELAVAASGGSLFQRICRLIQKDSTNIKADWMPSVIVVFLIIALLIPTGLALTARLEDKSAVRVEGEQTKEDSIFGAAKTRILEFPRDRSLGRVYICGQDGQEEWRHAQGEISVPPGKFVKLNMSSVTSSNISWLASLGPHDIQELDVHSRSLKDADLKHLKGLTGLRSLSLGGIGCVPPPYCPMTGEGLSNLSGMVSLRELELAWTDVCDENLIHLKTLRSLEKLTLLDNRKITGDGLVILEELPSLKNLSLYKTPVTNAGLRHLRNLPLLEVLNLQDTDVNDEGLAYVQELPKLKSLVLPPGITGEGLAKLKGLTLLEELSFGYTGMVTDAGLAHLKDMKSLRSLLISSNKMTGEVLVYL